MKKLVLALTLTLVATFATAQEQRRHVFIHGMGEDGGAFATALGLSAEQKTQWDAIHQQLAASAEPIANQIGAAEVQLDTLAEASSPDATAIGRQFLVVRSLQQQMKAAHESAKQKIEAILTPDQRTKLESMHGGMEHGPVMMKMRHPEPGSIN
jgi:Spy/CpxP family protein refolding chaperone